MSGDSIPAFEKVDGMTAEQAFASGYNELEEEAPDTEEVTFRLDGDVANYFRSMAGGGEAAINQALRAFMEAHK